MFNAAPILKLSATQNKSIALSKAIDFELLTHVSEEWAYLGNGIGGYDIDNNTVADNEDVRAAPFVLTQDIEINNRQSLIDKDSINNNEPTNSQVELFIPKVKEIDIPPPRAEGKKKLPQLKHLLLQKKKQKKLLPQKRKKLPQKKAESLLYQ